MTDLPYTLDHPDPLSAIVLTIDDQGIALQDALDGVQMPLGDLTSEEAARMARAVLAAAGDTGHRVVSDEDAHKGRLAAMRFSAEVMRERAAREVAAWIDGRPDIVGAIDSLPLLDGEDDAPAAEEPLARRVADLESAVAEQAEVIERQSRDIDTLGACMGNAHAALKGLAKTAYSVESDH